MWPNPAEPDQRKNQYLLEFNPSTFETVDPARTVGYVRILDKIYRIVGTNPRWKTILLEETTLEEANKGLNAIGG